MKIMKCIENMKKTHSKKSSIINLKKFDSISTDKILNNINSQKHIFEFSIKVKKKNYQSDHL